MPGGAGEDVATDRTHVETRRQLLFGWVGLGTPDCDSPYFAIVEPALTVGFDHHALAWNDRPASPRDTVRMAVS